MPVATYPLGPIETNCHIVFDKESKDAVVVDPGGDIRGGGLEHILKHLADNKLKIQAIVCTHLHFDHIYGVATLQEQTGVPVYASDADEAVFQTEMGSGGAWGFPKVKPFSWTSLKEGTIQFGSISMQVLNTPGHTPGSISLYIESMNSVLTGDLLFFHSVGRTDFPGSSPADMIKSLRRKIFILPSQTKVFPGHGPNTSVGEEQVNNPYLELF